MGRINAFRAVLQLKNDTVKLGEYSETIDDETGRPSTTLTVYDTVQVFNNPMPRRAWNKYLAKSSGRVTEMMTDIRSIYLTRFPNVGIPHVVIIDNIEYRVIEVEHRRSEGKYVLIVGRTNG